MLSDQFDALIEPLLRKTIRVAQNDGTCVFDLVCIELAEVRHVEFAFLCVNNSRKPIELNLFVVQILNGKKPSEIPVRFMTKPEDSDLLFDLDTAKACGISIPKKYLDKATYIYQNGKLTKK